MDQIPLKEQVYTINGIIHDFVIKNEKFFSSHTWDVLGCVLKLYIMDGRCSEVFQTSSSYDGRHTQVLPCISQEENG